MAGEVKKSAMKPVAKPAAKNPMAKPMTSSAGVPVGVKVISVLYYIGTVLLVLLGILMIVGGGAVGAYLGDLGGLGSILGGALIVVGIIMIGMAVLSFFVARGLWKGKNWARIVAIIFAVLGLIGAIMGIVQGSISSNIVSLIVNGVIGGYLLFSKGVKAAFA